MVGSKIAQRLENPEITADVFGYIVQAACLAHDIGNPPFGHSGEDAIRIWFQRAESRGLSFTKPDPSSRLDDFRQFEGNAQGFRLLTQLENNKWAGGLQLTFAVLGAFTKYPRASSVKLCNDPYPGAKKVGFFRSEEPYFNDVADTLGLVRRCDREPYWSRHPLAFLVEAADDICYAIIDIEDGHELGYLTFPEARDALVPLAGDDPGLDPSAEPRKQVGKLRAVAIGKLIDATAAVFLENEPALLDGSFGDDLVALTPLGAEVKQALELARKKLYASERKTKLEIAGSEIIGGLLDTFSQIVVELEEKNFDRTRLGRSSQRLERLMIEPLGPINSSYDALLRVTDFVSGMTDRFAVETYRTLKGISI
jgi:dGTPase